MKTIICYSLGDIEPRLRLKFNRVLYGYKDKSNHGKYAYIRQGILKQNYKKPLDAVIIIETNTKEVIKHLKKYKAKYIAYKLA